MKALLLILSLCSVLANTSLLKAQNNDNRNRKSSILRNQPEAEMIIRVGDIDNLGFGWPEGFNPFSGKDTEPHGYPWESDADDPPGTDRIFVVSSYTGNPPEGSDGYTESTSRPDNEPQAITLEYPVTGIDIQSSILQMFVDDFQAPVFATSYQVILNGKRIPYLENMINSLEQTGPIGKLITIKLLPEDINLIKSGKLVIGIDDKLTGAGDGFAIDFVRLLINPGKMPFTQNIHGKVLDDNTQQGIGGALVSASNIVELLTDADGNFALNTVPAGLALVTVSKSGYYNQTIPYDQVSYISPDPEHTDLFIIYLKKRDESVARMAEDLDKKGTLVLYSINFETGSAVITKTSEKVLLDLAEVIRERPDISIEVGGHTDSDGADDMNLDLSQRRAQAVVDWLVNKGIDISQLTAKGYGESNPMASNNTIEGKAANRRIEIKVMHK